MSGDRLCAIGLPMTPYRSVMSVHAGLLHKMVFVEAFCIAGNCPEIQRCGESCTQCAACSLTPCILWTLFGQNLTMYWLEGGK